MKINVVGSSGSGKSTLSKKLAGALNIPYLEMDDLFWKPNWEMPDDKEFFRILESALEQPHWVLDGNYNRTVPVKWQQVDIVVWVDYSFTRTLFQAIRRVVIRVVSRKELWQGTGNRESIKRLFSKDSIVLWTINTYAKNIERYERYMESEAYSHIQFIRIRSPKQAKKLVRLFQESSKKPIDFSALV